VATGQADDTNDHVSSDQHRTTWNAIKLTLKKVNQVSGAFPPLQTVTGLLLDLVDLYEVRYLALSGHSRINSSKQNSAIISSIDRVSKRIQSLHDSIVNHEAASGPEEVRTRKQLNMSVSLMSCIFLHLILNHPVD
jgi:endo-alpha-1,4-polygalactosaminidase (GH114 family)